MQVEVPVHTCSEQGGGGLNEGVLGGAGGGMTLVSDDPV